MLRSPGALPAVLLPIVAALLLTACTDPGRSKPQSADPLTAVPLTMALAGDRNWAQDAAANHCEIDYESGDGLAVTVHPSGQPKALIVREVDWNATQLQALQLDCHIDADQAPPVSLALKTAKGGWFETPAVPTSLGSNNVRFDLAGISESNWPAQRDRITRVILQIQTGPEGAPVRLLLADLHLLATGPVLRGGEHEVVNWSSGWEGPRFQAEALVRSIAPIPPAVDPDSRQPGPVLPDALFGRLRLRGPDGSERVVRGHLLERDDSGRARYGFRFTAAQQGTWHSQLGYQDGNTWRYLTPEVAHVAASQGVWHRDPDEAQVLRDPDGEAVWPLGQNLAWMGDPEPWLRDLSQAGGNLARVWLCPWHLQLPADGSWAAIDLEQARRLDRLFSLAEQYDVAIQLVLTYHGLIAGDWNSNPANRRKGGNCVLAEQFWIDPKTRRAYRRWLDYLVSRWGGEPHLFAWELINEANLTRRFADRHIIDWHREMAGHLRRRDVHGHLITTSTSHAGSLEQLWGLAEIDLIQVHAYTPAVPATYAKALALPACRHKPLMVAEFGKDWRPRGDLQDERGQHLHQALWTSWMQPLAGSSMPWWWDLHLEPRGLLSRYQAFAAFIAGEDRTGQAFRGVHERLSGSEPVDLHALIGRSRCYAYLCSPRSIDRGNAARLGPLLPAGSTLQLRGLADGPWTVELWDPQAGEPLSESTVTAQRGTAMIELPQVEEDLAVKLRRPDAPAGVGLEVPGP